MIVGSLTVEKTDWYYRYDERFRKKSIDHIKECIGAYLVGIEEFDGKLRIFYKDGFDVKGFLDEYKQFVKIQNGKI